MRKIYLMAGMWVALFTAKAQQTATFEEIGLQTGSFYNGADGAGGFQSGGIWFPNWYDSQFYWSGFSVSNMKDTTTAGYTNQFSVITAGGADSSENYAVVYAPQEVKLPFESPRKVEGFYVTNAVYAYLSMKNGDDWTKKFGGADGSEPDYFRLLVSGKDVVGNETDTVAFYLADFRTESTNEDYIVNDWQWLDLNSLGVVSELNFNLESSDVGEWGMNTPAYFCIDNLKVSDVSSQTGLNRSDNTELEVYPNPVKDVFRVKVPEGTLEIALTSLTGKLIWKDNVAGKGNCLISALNNMPSGIYFLQLKSQKEIISEKIIKY